MPNDLISPQTSRAHLRLLLECGAIRPAEVITWADWQIAADPQPDGWLIDLSISPVEETSAVLARQTDLPAPAEALTFIAALCQEGAITPSQSWAALLAAGGEPPISLPDDRLWDVYQIWDLSEDFPEFPAEADKLLQEIFRSIAPPLPS